MQYLSTFFKNQYENEYIFKDLVYYKGSIKVETNVCTATKALQGKW